MAGLPSKNRPHSVSVSEKYQLGITVRYISEPDPEARLSRAIDILLGAVTENTTLPGEGKGKDTLPSPPKESSTHS